MLRIAKVGSHPCLVAITMVVLILILIEIEVGHPCLVGTILVVAITMVVLVEVDIILSVRARVRSCFGC